MSDKLRTHTTDGRSSFRLRVVVVAVLAAGIAGAVPALAQGLNLDGPITDTTNGSATDPSATGTADPNASTADPSATGTADPNASTADPSATNTADPNASTADPRATNTADPNLSTAEPDNTSGADPNTRTNTDPDMSATDPNTRTTPPKSNTTDPTTSTKNPSDKAPGVDAVPAADKSGPSALLVALIALAALLAGAVPGRVVTRRILRRRRRLAWQLQARSEPPRRPCSQRSHYCQKRSIKLKPGRRDIAYLDLHARNGDAEELETRGSTRLVDELDVALRGYRHDRKREQLRTTLLPTAGLLVEEIESWLRDDTLQREITTEAHLTAAEVEYEFTLYRCSKDEEGPAWEKEDEWQASLEDEEDEDVAHLHRPRPASEDVDGLSAQLADFLTRVDVDPSLEVSSKPAVNR